MAGLPDDDPFPRRTATPAQLLPWLARVARDPLAQVGLYARRASLDRGLRERIMLAVTDVNGCRYCAWIHGGWSELVARGHEAREEIALAYAREAAELGELPPSRSARDALESVYNPAEVRAIDAAVTNIEISNLAGNTLDGLLARITGARPRDPLAMAQEAAVVAVALPIGLPLMAAGTLFRQAARAMPPVEIVVLAPPGEANMGVLLLTELVKKYSDLPLLRAVAAGRTPFALAASADGMAATVRLNGSRIELDNGIADDVALIVEGDIETMLNVAAHPSQMLSYVNQGRLTTRLP